MNFVPTRAKIIQRGQGSFSNFVPCFTMGNCPGVTNFGSSNVTTSVSNSQIKMSYYHSRFTPLESFYLPSCEGTTQSTLSLSRLAWIICSTVCRCTVKDLVAKCNSWLQFGFVSPVQKFYSIVIQANCSTSYSVFTYRCTGDCVAFFPPANVLRQPHACWPRPEKRTHITPILQSPNLHWLSASESILKPFYWLLSF